MLKVCYVLLCLQISVLAQMKELNIFPSSYDLADLSGIEILDVKKLSFETKNGLEFTEISALAYDAKKGLYALSDRGNIFRLELKIKDEKITQLKLEEARTLKTKQGKRLQKKKRDSEGMVLSKKGLVISFEGRPKVSLFDFNGRKIKNFPIAAELEDIHNYQTKNKALEAVTIHPDFGIITAPEAVLKGQDEDIHTLYSLQKKWRFAADGKITAIELMPDKSLLVLEREFQLLKGHKITLKKVNLMSCTSSLCPTQTLASLRSTQGWELDNFEGLTHIKDNMYMMISDDNDSFLQKCIVVLFQVR